MAKEQTAPEVDEAELAAQAAEMDRFIMETPIEELAKAQGITLDEAAQLKVERALEHAPVPVEIKVRPIAQQGKTLGFASVNVGGVVIDDFKLINGSKGVFLAAPSKPNPGGRGFRATVWLEDQNLRERMNTLAVDAYREAIDQLRSRADAAEAVLAEAEAGRDPAPAPIREQMTKAAKAAEKHNAQRTDKPKVREGRDDR